MYGIDKEAAKMYLTYLDVSKFKLKFQFPKNYPNNQNHYPGRPIQNKPFVLDGNNYYVTAYFVDPCKYPSKWESGRCCFLLSGGWEFSMK